MSLGAVEVVEEGVDWRGAGRGAIGAAGERPPEERAGAQRRAVGVGLRPPGPLELGEGGRVVRTPVRLVGEDDDVVGGRKRQGPRATSRPETRSASSRRSRGEA